MSPQLKPPPKEHAGEDRQHASDQQQFQDDQLPEPVPAAGLQLPDGVHKPITRQVAGDVFPEEYRQLFRRKRAAACWSIVWAL